MKNRLQQLQDDRLVARALFVAAEALATYPYDDKATSEAMMVLLHCLHPSLVGAFPTYAEIENTLMEEETLRDAERILSARRDRGRKHSGEYQLELSVSNSLCHEKFDDIPF